MRSATRAGFRIAGLMAMTFLIAHCGDSSTHIRTGGGVNPSAGTFQGTLDRDGSTITVVVDSIRSIAFQCDTDAISQTFEPPYRSIPAARSASSSPMPVVSSA